MLTLILETSTEKGCLVLAQEGIPLAFQKLGGGPELSKTLALATEKLLDGQTPEAIAVGTGPGSYTGIRVAVALAQGLSYGWQIPLVGFCSLKAFGPAPAILVDAKMGGFYALVGETVRLLSAKDPILSTLPEIHSPHPETLKKRIGSEPIFYEKEANPLELARLVHRQLLEEPIAPLTLTYLSNP